jgi:hypothetical protein
MKKHTIMFLASDALARRAQPSNPDEITLNLAQTRFTELPSAAANIPDIVGLPGQRVRS